MYNVTKSRRGRRSIQSTRWTNRLLMLQSTKISDMVSDSTLQLIFKNLSLVGFWHNKEYSQLHEKILKYSTLFQLGICVWPGFLHTLQTKQHYHNRLNPKAVMKIQLSSIKQYIKKNGKIQNNVTLLTMFFVLEYFFHKSMLFNF